MPPVDVLHEAERQFIIYCEGFCAVFRAMELRVTFNPGDLVYLSNLCHDCRACLYACQYAPPHAFSVNIPQALTNVRNDSYGDYSWPRLLAGVLPQARRPR